MIQPFPKPILVTQPLLPEKKAVFQKITEIFESKWLTNCGNQHKNFKEKLKNHLGAKNVSVFSNGTLALQLGLKALDLHGEVITTPFTFPATPHSLVWNNLTPVFCDINYDDFNINAAEIEKLITKKTSAIMPVHVFGAPCDLTAIDKIARKYNLRVIYDAAHAFGVKINKKPIGNFGDMSMFSFHATKSFNTIEGGALTYHDGDLAEKLYFLKNFGIKNQEEVITIGSNAKMNELQAAIGILNLDIIHQEITKRKKMTEIYRRKLGEITGIRFNREKPGISYNYQYMPVLIEADFGLSRDTLFEQLKEYNIFARKYFYPLCSDLECYEYLKKNRQTDVRIATEITSKILCLPLYGDLGQKNIDRICAIIKHIQISHQRKHKFEPTSSSGKIKSPQRPVRTI